MPANKITWHHEQFEDEERNVHVMHHPVILCQKRPWIAAAEAAEAQCGRCNESSYSSTMQKAVLQLTCVTRWAI